MDARQRLLQAGTAVVDDDAAPDADPLAVPSTGLRPFDQLGSYQVLKRLGGGGMAEVYLARARLKAGVEKRVALKIALPSFGPDTKLGAMFLNEARVSATLQHPNVIQVFDFGEAAGRPYLAMELVHGRDLAALVLRVIAAGGQFPAQVALAVASSLCHALEYVHGKRDLDGRPLKLVHRDVNPPNVFITRAGEVKLMDFGVVAAAAEKASSPAAGKSAYCCFEQLEADHTPLPDWDLYGVGVVLREMLTLECDVALRAVAPSQLSRAPPQLDGLVLKATAPEPAERFASAHTLRQALDAARAELPPADVAAFLAEHFGAELEAEQLAEEQLFAEGRRRLPLKSGPLDAAWLKPLRALRRRVASSRAYMAVARRRGAVPALVAAVLLAAAALGVLGQRAYRQRAAFEAEVATADARAARGRLVGASSDEALDHLLAAKAMRPDDPGVQRRLAALAERLEALGAAALARGDDSEAVVHFEAALRANPGLTEPRRQLELIEGRAREAARARLQERR